MSMKEVLRVVAIVTTLFILGLIILLFISKPEEETKVDPNANQMRGVTISSEEATSH